MQDRNGNAQGGSLLPDTVKTLPYYSNRLLNKLGMLCGSKASLIEAPSGYGKTTAVRDFLKNAAAHGDQVCWFTAVEEEPTALYRRLCREIERIDARTGIRLREIDFPNAFTMGEACDALRSIECKRKTWLVLDDFQFLAAILPTPFLNALIDHGKDWLHIVVVSQVLGDEFLTAALGRGMFRITVSDLQWDIDDIRSFFKSEGTDVPIEVAAEIKSLTNGWIIAVLLQLRAWQEDRAVSDKAIMILMEHLVWNKMTSEQQDFYMRTSPLKTITIERIFKILKCDKLPAYVTKSLTLPFIRYIADQEVYELHAIMLEMVRKKRRERGGAFDRECMAYAGDILRDEGDIAGALDLYGQVSDYERILALDLSRFVCAEIGNRNFVDVALEIAKSCPVEIRRRYPLSMLCVAWSVRLLNNVTEFTKIMEELDGLLPETGLLRAEWLLLSAYMHFPRISDMAPIVSRAAYMFDNTCSRVIGPDAPWAFYEYLQVAMFHFEVGEADREADRLEEFLDIYSKLTGGHGKGADSLFRAEIAFFRCQTSRAEISAYKAIFSASSSQQKIVQIGAARLLAAVALVKADADGWKQAVSTMEHAASGAAQNTAVFRAFLEVVRGTVMAELNDFARIDEWMHSASFLACRLPTSIKRNALSVHALNLISQGDYARLIGLGQSLPIDKFSAFSKHIHFLYMAVGFASLGDIEQARAYLGCSAEIVLPDGLIHYIAGLSPMLRGLAEELVENSYPKFFGQYVQYKDNYISKWCTLHNAIVADDLPSCLTGREREIAELAAEGLRNHEIAGMLFVSENTVRAHLRAVYQKLDIDRRSKLAKVLRSCSTKK